MTPGTWADYMSSFNLGATRQSRSVSRTIQSDIPRCGSINFIGSWLHNGEITLKGYSRGKPNCGPRNTSYQKLNRPKSYAERRNECVMTGSQR